MTEAGQEEHHIDNRNETPLALPVWFITLATMAIGIAGLWYGRGLLLPLAIANLRAVQFLLGHTRMDGTVRHLGVEIEDVLAISESVEI